MKNIPIEIYGFKTWPEIDLLPRDTPMIIPLGEGYDFNQVSSFLGNAGPLVILPHFPFGWKGSCLELHKKFLTPYLLNLVNSLEEDGFKKVFILAPPSLDIDLENHLLTFKELTYTQSNKLFSNDCMKDKVVLIPIGHTEQHSHHLPMATDTMIIQAISSGVVNKIPELCYSLPTMPYGVSTHRSSFCGTMNAGGRAFEDFWLEVIRILVNQGHDRFYFLNGHGGNHSFLVNVVKYAGDEFRRIFCATSWLYLSGPKGIKSLEKYRESPVGGMGHAGELETSIILHLDKELVFMERAIDDTNFITTPSYYMDWIEGGALIANPPWDDESLHGGYGAGSLGSSRKGKIWLKAAIQEKIAHVYEINEQHSQRELRRSNGYGLWINWK